MSVPNYTLYCQANASKQTTPLSSIQESCPEESATSFHQSLLNKEVDLMDKIDTLVSTYSFFSINEPS